MSKRELAMKLKRSSTTFWPGNKLVAPQNGSHLLAGVLRVLTDKRVARHTNKTPHVFVITSRN